MPIALLLAAALVSPAAQAREFGPQIERISPDLLEEEAEVMPDDTAPDSPTPLKWESFVATAYQPWCHGCSGRTADGTRADPSLNIIAVDPRLLSLGTRYVLRYPDGECKVFTARDTGGDIKGHRIDILMRTDREAFAWGVRKVFLAPIGDAEPATELLEASGCTVAPTAS